MSDFVESEAEESEEEYNQDGEVVPRVTKKFVEEDEDGESAELSVYLAALSDIPWLCRWSSNWAVTAWPSVVNNLGCLSASHPQSAEVVFIFANRKYTASPPWDLQ